VESSLEEIAAPALTEVDVARVPPVCFPDSTSKARLFGRYRDEMNMVGHQAPSKIGNTESLPLHSKLPKILPAVSIGEEDVHSSDTTLNNMMGQSGNDNTCNASHAQILS